MKRYLIPALAVALLATGCSKELESRVDQLENRVTAVENAVSKINQNISNLNDLVTALQNNDYVTDVVDVKNEAGEVIGYKISFSKRGTITIYHGKDGANGANGSNGTNAPVIGVKQDTDGIYYWTLGGEFLLVNNAKLPVTGDKGDTGATGNTPKLKIENEKWFVSYDNGTTWEDLGTAIGDTFFKDVTYDDDSITFILNDNDNTTITLPRVITTFSFKLETTALEIAAGETTEIGYTIKGAEDTDEIVFVATYLTPGWTVVFNEEEEEVAITAPDPITDATIVLQAVNNTTSATAAQALYFEKGVLTVETDAFPVGKDGDDIEVKVSTNVTYDIDIDVDWIAQDDTRAVRQESLFFTVKANTGAARVGKITLTGADESKVVVTVSQEAGEALPAIQVKPLFGFQPTVENPHGMTKDAHRTMAVVGDYLILSNAEDVSKMPVYNRFTGEYLGDDIINTSTITGLSDDQKFWAIASDDAGHLVAITFVDNRAAGTQISTNITVRGYIWKNGITQAPTSVWWAGFWNYSVGASYAFSNLKVAGDLTGDAVITSSAPAAGAAVFEYFTDGALKTPRLKKSLYEGSTWFSGNVVPIKGNAKSEDELEFISVSGNYRQYITYNNGAASPVLFSLSSSYWYYGGGTYQRCAIGGDYIDVAGHKLFGVLNGWYTGSADSYGNSNMYYQLVVSEIGATPGASAMDDGLIFATRSSSNGTTAEKSLEGMGFTPQSAFTPVHFNSAETVLGPNALAANQNQIGDVVFATSGANKVQVYAFAMNMGLFGYEITFND